MGERVAARWLRARGYRIVSSRWRCGHRDLDLVIERDGLVAFVEVKARNAASFGGPLRAVGWRKQRELMRSAMTWCDRHGRPGTCYRFDVFGVLLDGARVRVRHIEDAFTLRGRP